MNKDILRCNEMLNNNEMQNDDEAPSGELQEGGLPGGSFAGWAPPTLLQSIGTYKPILSTNDTRY